MDEEKINDIIEFHNQLCTKNIDDVTCKPYLMWMTGIRVLQNYFYIKKHISLEQLSELLLENGDITEDEFDLMSVIIKG